MFKTYNKIWLVDFEFSSQPGEKPIVRCMVAREFNTGQTYRIWEDELSSMSHPPFLIDESSLYVAYYASAEMACHLVLGWPLPTNILDLFTEFRNKCNGTPPTSGYGLLSALSYYSLDALSSVEKESMRNLAIRGGPYNTLEQGELLDYCESDVIALSSLLSKMQAQIDCGRALLRGRYMKAAAIIEHTGIPIDVGTLGQLKKHWPVIQTGLIEQVNKDYGVYDGRVFKQDQFEAWLAKSGIPWPRLPSGKLDLKDTTFKDMAVAHPRVGALRELRHTISRAKFSDLSIGNDNRNRCLLSAFRSTTGRNQPSNSKFIFGLPAWVRSLIKPESGYCVAYIDYSQQEFGIAAGLSNDQLMKEAYESGDPYLAFAKQAGAVPAHGTKDSHHDERDLFKACVLAVQYGMGAESLSNRIGGSVLDARELLQLHKTTYKVFWEWSDACLDHAMLHGRLWTVFGWNIFIGDTPNPRSIRNFPMQANGSEMLRLACCMALEAGIKVCAPVHDALLIEAPAHDIELVIQKTQAIMAEASAIVLNGFTLRSDAEKVCYPDRYMDKRGQEMWDMMISILEERSR